MTDAAEKINEILAREEEILSVAFAKSLAEVHKSPTAQNIRDYEASKAAYDEFKKKKQQQENPEQARFTAPEAVEYLKSEGYKIEKSKLYDEKVIIGYTTINNAVTFTKKDLDKYAKKFLNPLSESDSNNADSREKYTEETRLIRIKADKEELLLKVLGKSYVDIAQVERTRTAQTARLLLTYENLIYGKAEKLIELVGGDMTKKHELQAFLLGDQWFRGALREFAKKDRFIFSLPTKKMLEAIELFNEEDTNAT